MGAVVPTPAALVERLYSNGLYAALQPMITAASNRAPIAVIDVLLVAAAAGWAGAVAMDIARPPRRWLRLTLRVARRTLVLAAALYLAFLVLWGLNYRRLGLIETLQFDRTAVTPQSARDLATTAIERANALYDRAHAAPETREEIPSALAAAFAGLQRDLGAARLARPGRPKRTLLDIYFRRAGVEGMTDPYFLETLVASDLLPVERPFVVAHEWAHLAGHANEGEANFLGWLTCVRGGDIDQYSGWLFLAGELMGAARAADRAELADRLAPGPRADRRAIADRIRRNLSPRLSAAGWRVYDQYLKANRVEAGAASYVEIVTLALGVKFGPEWTPLRRQQGR